MSQVGGLQGHIKKSALRGFLTPFDQISIHKLETLAVIFN